MHTANTRPFKQEIVIKTKQENQSSCTNFHNVFPFYYSTPAANVNSNTFHTRGKIPAVTRMQQPHQHRKSLRQLFISFKLRKLSKEKKTVHKHLMSHHMNPSDHNPTGHQIFNHQINGKLNVEKIRTYHQESFRYVRWMVLPYRKVRVMKVFKTVLFNMRLSWFSAWRSYPYTSTICMSILITFFCELIESTLRDCKQCTHRKFQFV